MNFKSAKELLEICDSEGIAISEVMIRREETDGETPRENVIAGMHRAFRIMKESANNAIENPSRSMGGLLGGQARKLSKHVDSGKTACGKLVAKGIAYAMGVLEVNAQMGLIVAAAMAASAAVELLGGTLSQSLDAA